MSAAGGARRGQRDRRAPAARPAPSTVLALLVLGTLGGTALAAPLVSPYDPLEQNMGDFLVRPGPGHWCGTDQFGRDILSRIIWGGRLTLQVGLIAVGIAALAGVTLGLCAGFYGGWPDLVIMRLIDLLLAFPSMLLALGVVAVLGGSLPNVMIAVGIAGVPQFTRVVRAAVLGARGLPYVEAARAVGARGGAHHVAPHPAERPGACPRPGHDQRGRRDHHRRRAELPRPGRAAARAGMGSDAQHGPRVPPARAVDVRSSPAWRSCWPWCRSTSSGIGSGTCWTRGSDSNENGEVHPDRRATDCRCSAPESPRVNTRPQR